MVTFTPAASISSLLSSGGVSIWSEDPVHLSCAAYYDILVSLQAVIDKLVARVPGRGHIQSIIPTQTTHHEVPATPTPSWILGELLSLGATRGGQVSRGGF